MVLMLNPTFYILLYTISPCWLKLPGEADRFRDCIQHGASLCNREGMIQSPSVSAGVSPPGVKPACSES
jgi:hypothetical protein